MQIKKLAKRANLSAKTIRYYESIGLLPPPCRQSNNYRDYDEEDVARVKFVVAARNLGLSLAEIADLLSFHRQAVLTAVYEKYPERFVKGPPVAPKLPTAVWINPPAMNSLEKDGESS